MKDIEKIEKILKAVGFNLYNGNVPIMIGGRLYAVEEIPNDLNAIRELELLVMEKVGAERYGYEICDFFDWDASGSSDYAFLATADAPTRIAAMVAALEGDV